MTQDRITLFQNKNTIYAIKKEDYWKIFSFLLIAITPLIVSSIKFYPPYVSITISTLFLIAVLILGWKSFVFRIVKVKPAKLQEPEF